LPVARILRIPRPASSSRIDGLDLLLEETNPVDLHQERHRRQTETERQKIERNFAKLRREQSGRGSLIEFVRYFWHTLEPASRKLVEGWPLEAVCPQTRLMKGYTIGDNTHKQTSRYPWRMDDEKVT
jgi:hypothetical protein